MSSLKVFNFYFEQNVECQEDAVIGHHRTWRTFNVSPRGGRSWSNQQSLCLIQSGKNSFLLTLLILKLWKVNSVELEESLKESNQWHELLWLSVPVHLSHCSIVDCFCYWYFLYYLWHSMHKFKQLWTMGSKLKGWQMGS